MSKLNLNMSNAKLVWGHKNIKTQEITFVPRTFTRGRAFMRRLEHEGETTVRLLVTEVKGKGK